jgi:hypothetical protein
MLHRNSSAAADGENGSTFTVETTRRARQLYT